VLPYLLILRCYRWISSQNCTYREFISVQKIESYDFKVVSDLCGVVNHDADKETQLVDLLAAYFESVGKTSDLLQWAIQWEVAKTGSCSSRIAIISWDTKTFLSSVLT
jgi:hypothetical protein